MSRVRILLADDQSIILDGLEALIAQTPEFVVCGRAGNGREAVDQARALRPDVVLMDVSMPELDGIEATRQVKKMLPRTQVLVLTMYNSADLVHELMEAGASGYLLKNTGRKELHEAITAVAAGRRYMAASVQEVLDAESRRAGEGRPRETTLTKREKEVVMLIAAGRTTQEIADKLFLSPATIETHRKNIFHKLDCRNYAALVKYALERGWLVDTPS
jgi:two-component system response regulator NreC